MASQEEHTAHDAAAEQQLISDVAKYGWHVAMVESDGYSPGFAYTIGLHHSFGYPELICFGMAKDLLHSMLWTAKELLDKHPDPDLTISYPDFLEGYEVRFLRVDRAWYRDYFGYGRWFYKSWDFPVLQLVWPDKSYMFPWQKGFNPNWKFKQPLLDRDLDFKFREERNVAVFTTRQVLAGRPILRVVHEANGDWQFLCDTTYNAADLKIIALSEIVRRDSTLNELFQLNYGWDALREAPGGKWTTGRRQLGDDSDN